MRILLICVLVLSCLLAAPRSWSFEPLTATQLDEVCADYREQRENPDALLCVYYVKGFLDGAVATDGRVAENVAAEIEKEETFTERAIRTRIGNRLKKYGPSVYAEFCVGQPDPIADVVSHVIEELDRYDDLAGEQAQTVVYDTLRRHYPCNAE